MARRKRPTRMNHCDVKQLLVQEGLDFSKDFFVLKRSEVDLVLDAAKLTGYHKRKDAPGSRARMYYGLLQNLNRCRRG